VSKKRAATEDEHGGAVDALFQLPLAEFTAARNALASRLKKAGHAEQSDAIKGLQKPPISAWAVNQLFWKHRGAFDTLLDAGQQFRTAQAAQLGGRSGDLRGPLEARREALANLSKRAAQVLRDVGNAPSPDVMRRVTTTLEALSTYGGLEGTPQPGRLSDDVDPPGFETLAALVPRVGDGGAPGPSRVLRFQPAAPRKKPRAGGKIDPKEQEREREAERKAQLAAARTAVQQGERALRDARKHAEHAETQLKKAAARTKEAERELREIEKEKAAVDRRCDKAAADAEGARQEARGVAERAEAAAESVEDAERELDKARRELEALSD
jgi:DNA repair exonuclease SbcCD ATPase subunit